MPRLPTAARRAPWCVCLGAALAVAWPVVVPARAVGNPVELAMEDQFGTRHETARRRGDVVVLVYAERHGAEAAIELGRRLHLRFHPAAATAPPEAWATQPPVAPAGWPAGTRVPDVHVVPVACLPEVPKPLRTVARSRFRKDSPHLSVWLDFDDDLRGAFGMVEGAPNTAVIDTAGLPRGVVPGVPDERRFEELARFIDGLRLAARPEPRVAALPTPQAVPVPLPAAPPAAVVPAAGVR